jgi:hypothetical protein
VDFHYEQRVIHGKDMLVKILPTPPSKDYSDNSRFKRRASEGNFNSIAKATRQTKHKFRPKKYVKKNKPWREDG